MDHDRFSRAVLMIDQIDQSILSMIDRTMTERAL